MSCEACGDREAFELAEWVETALIQLENGDHATAGRDFGRGIAYAAKTLRAAIASPKDGSADPDDLLPHAADPLASAR